VLVTNLGPVADWFSQPGPAPLRALVRLNAWTDRPAWGRRRDQSCSNQLPSGTFPPRGRGELRGPGAVEDRTGVEADNVAYLVALHTASPARTVPGLERPSGDLSREGVFYVSPNAARAEGPPMAPRKMRSRAIGAAELGRHPGDAPVWRATRPSAACPRRVLERPIGRDLIAEYARQGGGVLVACRPPEVAGDVVFRMAGRLWPGV